MGICSCTICKAKRKEYAGKNNPMYGTHRRGEENPFYNCHHTKDTKQKLRKPKSDSSKMGIYKRTKKIRTKLSITKKELWKNPEYAAKMGRAFSLHPNKPETFLMNLLEKLYPREWKYTGDFSFMINGKNPDFTNINGQKKLIELFGDYWHRGENPQDRIDMFKPFGWDTLVLWEKELKDKNKLQSTIHNFVRA